MKYLQRSMAILLLLSCAFATAQDDPEPRVKISTPGYYYVEPDNTAQDSQSAAITLTIVPRRGQTIGYAEGLQVVFKTEQLNGNNANITLQINTLGAERLLTRESQEFGIGELDAGVMLTATYDGDDFIADYGAYRQFRFVEADHLALTGNAYTVTDSSIPPIISAPVLLGIKAEATNTGNVTLSVNGSLDYAVFLSNGEQIPAGALEDGEFILCSFTNVGSVGFRAINLRPARSLKGTLLATATVAAGDYDALQYIAPWVLESGVTELSVETLPGALLIGNDSDTASALLGLTGSRLSSSQLGWFFEVLNGTTVVAESLLNFGSSAAIGGGITTDNADVVFYIQDFGTNYFEGGTIDRPTLGIATLGGTIPSGYSIKFYLSEN